MFMLCVMQIGPMPVLVPAVLWLWLGGRVGLSVALALWAVTMAVGESLLRPWLIRRGAKLSFILILGGVIGGLLAFGVAGIFIGPILLAVVKRLLERWLAEPQPARRAAMPTPLPAAAPALSARSDE